MQVSLGRMAALAVLALAALAPTACSSDDAAQLPTPTAAKTTTSTTNAAPAPVHDPGLGVKQMKLTPASTDMLAPKTFDESSTGDQLPLFTDVSKAAGIEVSTGSARLDGIFVPARETPKSMGQMSRWLEWMFSETYFVSGQAWGDFDRNGTQDLYVTNQRGDNHLFTNQGNGTFAPSPLSAQLQTGLASGGALWFDADNDAWPDLVVLTLHGPRLFHNDHGKAFKDVTNASGLIDDGKGSTAAAADVDGDGDLDLFLANYGCQPCMPTNNPPAPAPYRGRSRLFFNNGDGTFEDETKLIEDIPGAAGFALSAVWFDADGSGRPSLLIANDSRSDRTTYDVKYSRYSGDGSTPGSTLIHNDGPGCGGWCFSDRGGVDVRGNNMGADVGDVDGDGHLDAFMTDSGYLAGPTHLLHNDGKAKFSDVGEKTGTAVGEWSWGTSMLDVNNDGRLDIFLSVGYSDLLYQVPITNLTPSLLSDPDAARAAVAEGKVPALTFGYSKIPWPVAKEDRPRTDNERVLVQQGDGSFTVNSIGRSDVLSHLNYGNAVADYDNDGWPDVVIGNLDGGYSLLRNRGVVGAGNHRLLVRLAGDGKKVNRDAVGATVTVTTPDGTRYVRQVKAGNSLGGGGDLRLLVGIGKATSADVSVRWTDGKVDRFRQVAADSYVEIGYGHDKPIVSPLSQPVPAPTW